VVMMMMMMMKGFGPWCGVCGSPVVQAGPGRSELSMTLCRGLLRVVGLCMLLPSEPHC
jgi:hypothetical protein